MATGNYLNSTWIVVLHLNNWFSSYSSKNSIALCKHRQWKNEKTKTQKHFGKCLNVHFCFIRLIGPWHWIKHDLMSAGWNCIYLVNLKGRFFFVLLCFSEFWQCQMWSSDTRQMEPTHTLSYACVHPPTNTYTQTVSEKSFSQTLWFQTCMPQQRDLIWTV